MNYFKDLDVDTIVISYDLNGLNARVKLLEGFRRTKWHANVKVGKQSLGVGRGRWRGQRGR